MNSFGVDQKARQSTFEKETLINGQPARITCVEVDGATVSLEGRFPRIARLEDEWYVDLPDASRAIRQLGAMHSERPDILTFWQRPPAIEPRFDYYREHDHVAVLPITSYDHWWRSQISAKTRNRIRKAHKEGLAIRQVEFDDGFVDGMTGIFNESPIRQGKAFWHYGKDQATVRRQFSRFLFREELIGAYVDRELAGFVMLGFADNYALLGQILGSLKHRDKSPTNALMAKAVEICAQRQIQYLVYYYWSEDSLADFKRHSGFQRMSLPRYFIPLTVTGRIAIRLGVHRGWKAMIPANARERLKSIRTRWNDRRYV